MGPKIIKKGGPQRDPRASNEKYKKNEAMGPAFNTPQPSKTIKNSMVFNTFCMLRHLVSSRFFCSKALKKTTPKWTPTSLKINKNRVPNSAPKKVPTSDPKHVPTWELFGPKRPPSRLPEPSGMPAVPPRTLPEVLRGFQEPPGTLQGSILTPPGAVWESILTAPGEQNTSKIAATQCPN